MRTATIARAVALVALAAVFSALAASAADCTRTSVGFTPLNDLGAGLYLGQFQGGLYPGGANAPPPAHATAGRARALAVAPLNSAGAPDPNGKYVLLSIGMSNTTQEFCCHPGTFMGRAAPDARVNHTTLVIANGAAGGQTTMTWDQPTDPNYDRVRDSVLAPLGATEAQVQAVWVKLANAQPMASLPAGDSDAYALETMLGGVMRAVRTRYPNVKLVFLASRIYAGYASTTLNPEPYAYESAFGVKWLIEAQINQMAGGGIDPRAGDLNYNTVAPWIGWGPYLWADGLTPRSDGLTWLCADLEADGTHPSTSGETKVGGMLLNFMLTSPLAAPWFRVACPGDLNGDGVVGGADLALLLGSWGSGGAGDLDADGVVGALDLAALLGSWGPCS